MVKESYDGKMAVWNGQFDNDVRNGPARFVDETSGYTFEGNYCNDKRIDGVIRWLNGNMWVGRFLGEGIECEGVRLLQRRETL